VTGSLATRLADRLDAELTVLAIAQFETPEFRLFFDTPFTIERARFVAAQLVFYNVNRRDCWAYVQAKAPWDVKRVIWEHEKDELFFDPRGGSDHRALVSKEALALGVTVEELRDQEPTPLLDAVLRGWCHAAATLPWLAALTASHFLERRNNSDLIPGGGYSKRFRSKLVNELHLNAEILVNSNVHVEADIDHSDAIWEAIAGAITDEYAYETAMTGARTCATLDRAYRGACGFHIRALPGAQ
jgi:hypothetical protein